MARVYAIGDIHGHLDLLAQAHRLIAADRKRSGDDRAPVVHLGDLVDRGPESAEVVEFLRMGPTGGAPWITIRGNHDYLFELFLRDPALKDPGLRPDYGWLHPRVGGMTTLASYGLPDVDKRAPRNLHAEALARIPLNHRAFLRALPDEHALADLFFVHAGIRPGVAFPAQSRQDKLWIRKDFHNSAADHGPLIIHGHTPVDMPTHYGNRLNLDTGAAYGGPLIPVVIEGRAAFALTEDGRQPLPISTWEKI